MSSTEDDSNLQHPRKRRKVTRACDSCKQRKKRCDGPTAPLDKCSHCIAQGSDCVFTIIQKKRGRPKGYIFNVEKRCILLENLIIKLCPDPTVLHDLIYPLDPDYATELTNKISSSTPSNEPDAESVIGISSTESSSGKESSTSNSLQDIIHQVAALTLDTKNDSFHDDDTKHVLLSEQSTSKCEIKRFYGNSGGGMLIQTVTLLRNEISRGASVKSTSTIDNKRPIASKRSFWEKEPPRPTTNYTFPPPDLISKLVTAYFEHMNVTYPLLHRPTFERAIESGLHLTDEGFGGVLLLVSAVGSLYTDEIDERTLTEGTNSSLSSGWKYYSQVPVVKQRTFEPATLYDLQSYSLAVMFMFSCYVPQTLWILTGFGIRLAQDVGANLRRVPRENLTVEDELWKRAFWVLVALDRYLSMGNGRPCAIFDDHIDVDMPIECDDEYWEHADPRKRFRQPQGIPTTITAFKHLLQLYKIAAFAMNTIYTMKTKIWESVVQKYDHHIVVEIDSALNNWINSLPEYLRWDHNGTDNQFLKVSGNLITTYFYIQIFIHRPYFTEKAKHIGSTESLPHLSVCNSAAKSCSLVLEKQLQCFKAVYPYMQTSSAVSALVLLLKVWNSGQQEIEADRTTMRQIEICMDVLRKTEGRSRTAGILLDVLNELSVSGHLLTPEDSESTNTTTVETGGEYSSYQSDLTPAQGRWSSSTTPSLPFSSVLQDDFFSLFKIKETLDSRRGYADNFNGTFDNDRQLSTQYSPETNFETFDPILPHYNPINADGDSSISGQQSINNYSISNTWYNAPSGNGYALNEWNFSA